MPNPTDRAFSHSGSRRRDHLREKSPGRISLPHTMKRDPRLPLAGIGAIAGANLNRFPISLKHGERPVNEDYD